MDPILAIDYTKMKDDKIDNLLKEVEDQKRKIDEMMRDNKQIMKQTEQVIIEDTFILRQIASI
jgi:transcription initiation factor IIF auxiliary subunit